MQQQQQQQQPRQADITRDSSSTGATNPISAEQKKRIKDRERCAPLRVIGSSAVPLVLVGAPL